MRSLNFIATLIVFIPCILIVSNFKLDGDNTTLEIASSQEIFKVIDNNTLQVTGDPSKIILSCYSAPDRNRSVIWRHHESKLCWHNVGFNRKVNDFHHMSIHFIDRKPPVVRLECHLKKTNVSRNMLIYTGVNEPPYIYKNKDTVRAVAIDETTVVLPCLLKYPLDLTGTRTLRLFKDGKIIRNANYVPELGYLLDLTKVKQQPFGSYKCIVLNSTKDDYIYAEVNEGSFLNLTYQGHVHSLNFYEGSTEEQLFKCTAPKSMFKGRFRWYQQMADGSLMEFIKPEKGNSTSQSQNSGVFTDSVSMTFGTREITHVVCSSESKGSVVFNSSMRVKVIGTTRSVILTEPGDRRMQYRKGTTLKCTAIGFGATFRWFKDDEIVADANIYDESSTNKTSTSLPILPSVDDSNINYTCCATNKWGQACKSYIVDVNYQLEEPSWPVYTLSTTLVILTFLLVTMLTFWKLTFTARFPKSLIDEFIDGCKPLLGEPKAFSRSFDKDKIIEDKCIQIEKRISKGGNFGVVEFGWYDRESVSLHIAKKSMKPLDLDKTKKMTRKEKKEAKENAFRDFLREIKLHASLGDHPYVVKLIGATATDKNLKTYKVSAILEYCDDDLGSYIWRNKNRLRPIHLLKWALEIATGMEYLFDRKFLHLDLATRNILLQFAGEMANVDEADPAHLTAKIADLGLAKDLNGEDKNYYISVRDLPMPIESIAPETLELEEEMKFTPQNDIWAIGLLFYEMFSLGDTAYSLEGKKPNRKNMLEVLNRNEELSRPESIPPEIWEIIEQCLRRNPDERPSFAEISSSLQQLQESFANEEVEPIQPRLPPSYCQVGLDQRVVL